MARSRNIKPGLFKNEVLGVADPLYTLAFQGLWLLADREGRLEDRPLRIKAETFPYRETVDINSILDWLHDEGFIQRYQAGDKRYIQVLNFGRHQNPHKNETPSEIPAFEDIGSDTEIIGTHSEKIGSTPADSLLLIPDSLNLNSDADASVVDRRAVSACPAKEIVALYHAHMPLNPRVKVLNKARKSAISTRWREASMMNCAPFAAGYSTKDEGLNAWRKFFEICADSQFLTGRAVATPGKPPFIATIDFLVSPSGFVNCLENKYHREVL